MPELTEDATREAYAAQTANAYLLLYTITGADLPATIYLAANNEDVVSNGNTFIRSSIQGILPQDTLDEEPRARVQIGNVDRAITDALLSVGQAVFVKLQVVLSSAPDDIQLEIEELVLRDFQYDALTISAELQPFDILSQQIPSDRYDATQFPGLA